MLPAQLHLGRDREQGLHFFGDLRVRGIELHALNQLFVTAEVMRRDGAVDALAIGAVVPRRNVSRNQFALAA